MAGFDLSNFIASFFDEARERLSSINQALVDFEQGTLNDEGLNCLRRDAHTIKGSALMLGINDVGDIAHIFEDLVEDLIKYEAWRTPTATQYLYDLHDLLDQRLVDPETKDFIDVEEAKRSYATLLDALKKGPQTEVNQEAPAVLEEKENSDVITSISGSFPVIEIDEGDNDVIFPDLSGVGDGSLEIDLSMLDLPMLDYLENDSLTTLNSKSTDVVIDETEEIDLEVLNDSLENALVDSPSSKENPAEVKVVEPKPQNAVADLGENSKFRPVIREEGKKGSGQRKSSGRFLRVDAERLESLSHQVIEMSTEEKRNKQSDNALQKMQSDLRSLRREWQTTRHLVEAEQPQTAALIHQLMETQVKHMRRLIEETRFQSERSALVLTELRDQVLGLMLRPLDSIFSTFPRAVRDIATKVGKQVRLVVDGKTVEMDQGVAESLVEPLVHLLNNAAVHGIESAEERMSLGKPAEGQISIVARQNGNEVRIEVIDDGRGIDTALIKRLAVERGVTTQDEVDLMDSAEILEMIFRPGFTTLTSVDTLAGRGIGMNVVQDTIRRLTGSIRIDTEVGVGTRFMISVPVSVAVQQALMFMIGGQQYGMLTHMVEQVVPYHEEEMSQGTAGKKFLSYEGHQVPIVDLRSMMAADGVKLSENPYIVVSEHIEGYVGIVLDELLGDGEVVVRDLDPYIKRYHPQGLMGNTIADNGSVVMLLEPYGIKEMGRTAPDQNLKIHVEEADKLRFNILLVDDSLIAREVEKSIFESLGFEVDTAIDGVDGLEKLESGQYDMVVTDLEMPRLDGFGLVRQIRNKPEYADLPLMVISTRESSQDRMRALEAGADSYLVKQHLDGDSIIATVKGLVGPQMVKTRGIEQQSNSAE